MVPLCYGGHNLILFFFKWQSLFVSISVWWKMTRQILIVDTVMEVLVVAPCLAHCHVKVFCWDKQE